MLTRYLVPAQRARARDRISRLTPFKHVRATGSVTPLMRSCSRNGPLPTVAVPPRTQVLPASPGELGSSAPSSARPRPSTAPAGPDTHPAAACGLQSARDVQYYCTAVLAVLRKLDSSGSEPQRRCTACRAPARRRRTAAPPTRASVPTRIPRVCGARARRNARQRQHPPHARQRRVRGGRRRRHRVGT